MAHSCPATGGKYSFTFYDQYLVSNPWRISGFVHTRGKNWVYSCPSESKYWDTEIAGERVGLF